MTDKYPVTHDMRAVADSVLELRELFTVDQIRAAQVVALAAEDKHGRRFVPSETALTLVVAAKRLEHIRSVGKPLVLEADDPIMPSVARITAALKQGEEIIVRLAVSDALGEMRRHGLAANHSAPTVRALHDIANRGDARQAAPTLRAPAKGAVA